MRESLLSNAVNDTEDRGCEEDIDGGRLSINESSNDGCRATVYEAFQHGMNGNVVTVNGEITTIDEQVTANFFPNSNSSSNLNFSSNDNENSQSPMFPSLNRN